MASADVLVVGASAAGIAAARTAARAGARVVLVETKAVIGTPEPAAIVAFDFLWTASFLPQGDEIRHRLDGVRLQSPEGNAVEIAAPLSILDRMKLDARLAGEAEAAGARIVTGAKDVTVRGDHTALVDGETLKPAVIIFADGPATMARRFMQTVRHPQDLLWGAAMRVQRAGASKERLASLTFGAHAHGGRSQLNPIGDDAWVHWTFYRGTASEAPARARAALDLDVHLRGWDAAIVDSATYLGVAPDPVLTVPAQLVADGVMAVGGAAGQAGVEVGFAAGEIAGEVAASAALSGRTDARALSAYERRWRRDRQWGYRAVRVATNRLARLNDASIDRLLAPWSGWRIPVRDFIGLGHPDPRRRVEALSKFAARNPHALPGVARVGVRALWPL